VPVPVDVPTGWECPRCRRVYAPRVEQCLPCSPPPSLFAGPLSRPEPRRFPHPVGGLPAETFGVWPSTEVTAEAEEAWPTVRLPPLMARPGYRQVSRLVREWREVFPGLQARVPDEGTVQVDIDFRLTPKDGQEHD
jgi:hypothetical protein